MKYLLFSACLAVFLLYAACGPSYPLNSGIKNFNQDDILVELIKTSEDEPLPLCGEEEVVLLLQRLVCPSGKPLFQGLKEAFAREDLDYRSSRFADRRVRRFIGFCHEKQYTLFLDMDACKDPRRYEPIWFDEN